jgi:alkanesulfonate monooxygenase SsuD/methylene tetrahydromethanopterin reductase-like flavin-dependent oxidoreductase (luciferase family)
VRLGLLVEAEEGLTWPAWRTLCRAADALGFASLRISDHLSSPWSEDRRGLEAWTALAVAAAETWRVLLGPLVSPVTFREPALVARMADSLHELSVGRFTLGLGLGWNRAEHEAFGVAFPPVAERARRLAETVERLRASKAAADVPVLIGGGGERATLPLVARHADAWNLTTGSAETVQAKTAVVARLCAELGRDVRQIRRSVAVGVLVGRDARELRERGWRMQQRIPPLAGVDIDAVPDAARSMGWVVGTAAEVVEQLRPLAEEGVQEVMLGIYDHADVRALELIADQVMPKLE